jgi:hypothetical protein
MQLPTEIIVQIAENLDSKSLLSLKLTSKGLKNTISSHQVSICKSIARAFIESEQRKTPYICMRLHSSVPDLVPSYTLLWLHELEYIEQNPNAVLIEVFDAGNVDGVRCTVATLRAWRLPTGTQRIGLQGTSYSITMVENLIAAKIERTHSDSAIKLRREPQW